MGDDNSQQQALQDLINKTNADAQGASSPAPGTSGQAAASIGAHYLAAARSGTFAIDPQVGENYLRAINKVIDSKSGLQADLRQIQNRTRLGDTPHAAEFADWNEKVTATGPFAFVPVHEQSIQAWTNMVQALQIAMDNYRKTDDGSAGTLKSIENR